MPEVRPAPADDESYDLFSRLFDETRLSSYDNLGSYTHLPLHVHSRTGPADLGPDAIHAFPDGYDDPGETLYDCESGSPKVVLFGGDVRCASFSSSNFVGVSGTVFAKVIEVASGCNRVLVAKRIVADFIHENGHSFSDNARIEVTLLVSEHDMVEAVDKGVIVSRLKEGIQAAFISEDGWLEEHLLLTAILEGKPWLERDSR